MNSNKSDTSNATKTASIREAKLPPQATVNVAFDVGSEALDWAMELSEKVITGHCENRSPDIRDTLNAIRSQVNQSGHDQVRVICESTGIYHRRLLQLAGQFKEQQGKVERQMQELYKQLQSIDSRLPSPCKGVVSLRMLSRLVAEIGPPDDFKTIHQLMRYAGLNLCERQSGKWRGRTTISRRGRSELRYVLNLMAIPVVSQGKLYSEYYRGKKDTDKMPGQKAFTCVMRKLLKMLYGWYKSGRPFDADRVFVMASQHARVR